MPQIIARTRRLATGSANRLRAVIGTGRQLRSPWITRVLVAGCILCCSGCGNQKPKRAAIEGTVYCDGEPLAEGSIMFVPMAGTTGPKTGATIEDGRYHLPAHEGPLVGTQRVEIWSEGSKPPDPHAATKAAGQPKAGYRKTKTHRSIPDRYNRTSTLQIETHAEGINRFDFELTTKP